MYAYEYMCVCMHSSHIKINAGGKGPNGFTYYFCELKSSHKFCGRHPKSKVININESASRRLQGCEGVFIMLPASWKDEHSTNRYRNIPNPYPRGNPPSSRVHLPQEEADWGERGCRRAGEKGLLPQKPP